MSEFYYYVWALYTVAAVGLLYLGWLMFRNIKIPMLALAFIALLAAMLFTPARIIPGQEDLTPALMVALFDGIAGGWDGVWNGLKYILLVYVALLSLLVLGYAIKAVFRPKPTQNNATDNVPK